MDDRLTWEILSTRTLVKDPWIDLRASRCRLPGGTVIEPYYVNHTPDFVVVVAVDRRGRLVMVRQYRHGLEQVLLELPAGMIEPGEEPAYAAKRELLEETGYRADRMEFLFKVAPNASSVSNYAWCYLARGVEKAGGQSLDETEALEALEMDMEKVKGLLASGGIVQAVHVAALYRALQQMEAS